jgi:NAD+ diphosphatase
VRAQPEEIEAANWFDVLQLPKLPSKISIARRLIDAVAAEIRGEQRSA